MDGRASGEDLGGVERGVTINTIYCVRKNLLKFKEKLLKILKKKKKNRKKIQGDLKVVCQPRVSSSHCVTIFWSDLGKGFLLGSRSLS